MPLLALINSQILYSDITAIAVVWYRRMGKVEWLVGHKPGRRY